MIKAPITMTEQQIKDTQETKSVIANLDLLLAKHMKEINIVYPEEIKQVQFRRCLAAMVFLKRSTDENEIPEDKEYWRDIGMGILTTWDSPFKNEG